MTPGKLVRDARDRNGLSQQSLARRCQTTQRHISRIERDEVSPSVDTLSKIMRALGERLELTASPGPRSNQTTAELHRALLQSTASERFAETAELSEFLTGVATTRPRSTHEPRMSPHEGSGKTERMPPLKASDLLRTLNRHDVEFVVIGGFSLAAHSVARATKDLDIVPETSRPNLERLMAALEELAAEPVELGEFEAAELVELNVENLLLGGNWVLRTRFGRLDLMQYVIGVRGYEQLREGAVQPEIEMLEESVQFAGLDDLVAMKAAAGRDQDLIDIDTLERSRRAG